MSTIKLFGGRYFRFDSPETFDYKIEELAHGIAMQCRFTGHARRHYSVAQHSVAVSYLVPLQYRRQALLHDVHEALIGDMASPLKALMPQFALYEQRLERCVRDAFGIPAVLDHSVKTADLWALLEEKAALFGAMPEDDYHWPAQPVLPETSYGVKYARKIIRTAMHPLEAKNHFLARYRALTR